MINICIFGSSTPAGESFIRQIRDKKVNWNIYCYSRSNEKNTCIDLNKPNEFIPITSDQESIWISFSPIWLFANFFSFLSSHQSEKLKGIKGVIACSSSSSITKRFSSNLYDRQLSKKLLSAENKLVESCKDISLNLSILRPSLVYGKVGKYKDKNISKLIYLLRKAPFLPIPLNSGLRQPIHASQLALITLDISNKIIDGLDSSLIPNCIEIGGDTTLSYNKMLKLLIKALPKGDPGKKCILIPIPNRIFNFLFAPMIIFSPKTFEAILRMSSDLSGFIEVHKICKIKSIKFPLDELPF